jgi:hypothetical protein
MLSPSSCTAPPPQELNDAFFPSPAHQPCSVRGIDCCQLSQGRDLANQNYVAPNVPYYCIVCRSHLACYTISRNTAPIANRIAVRDLSSISQICSAILGSEGRVETMQMARWYWRPLVISIPTLSISLALVHSWRWIIRPQ